MSETLTVTMFRTAVYGGGIHTYTSRAYELPNNTEVVNCLVNRDMAWAMTSHTTVSFGWTDEKTGTHHTLYNKR